MTLISVGRLRNGKGAIGSMLAFAFVNLRRRWMVVSFLSLY